MPAQGKILRKRLPSVLAAVLLVVVLLWGRNNGAVPLVIYLSRLLPTNAPRAIAVEATPVP